jgi:hypothetical protein
MKRLKEKWGIESNTQLTVIFIVFAITGSCAAKLAEPLTEFLGFPPETTSGWLYWTVRIFSVFPLYQVLLIFFGTIFGQFKFFWEFEKKMLRRMGLGFLFAAENPVSKQ